MKYTLCILVVLCISLEFTDAFIFRRGRECHCHCRKKRSLIEDLSDEALDTNGDGHIDRREAATLFSVSEDDPTLDLLMKAGYKKRDIDEAESQEEYLDTDQLKSLAGLMDNIRE